MLKHLVKDSVIYAVANVLQKLVPFLVIPVITTYLGDQALKVYDVSFIYAYLFSWLLILGQDSAAAIFYFSNKEEWNKKQVLNHGFLLQFLVMLVAAMIFLPLKNFFAQLIFHADNQVKSYWLKALLIVPAHIVLNYVLNILIWQKKKKVYFFLCLLQVIMSLAGVWFFIVSLKGSIDDLFYVIIVSCMVTAAAGLILVRKEVFGDMHIDFTLLRKMALIGLPFALTSFFHQLLPSIDRYFLLEYNYQPILPQYIVAVKIGGLLSIGISGFALAFTPYSMSKINDSDGERDISALFRFISAIALMAIPLVLLFKSVLIDFFANSSYSETGYLLPLMFFAWVFDLFSYFSLLGVYKSRKSHLVLWIFIGGVVVISAMNILLVPRFGIYGAAASFCITKAALFFVPLVSLRKYFRIAIELKSFMTFLMVSVICCYLIYKLEFYQYVLVIIVALTASLYYLAKLFQKHRSILAV
jgi:O-antigen/teichoic acid export membrane protein